MSDAQYRDPAWRPHEEVEAIFAHGTEAAICEALAGAALNDEDATWIEAWCVSLAESESVDVRGLAATSLGHVARRFGRLDAGSVALLQRMRGDPDVGARAEDALDDVLSFARQSI